MKLFFVSLIFFICTFSYAQTYVGIRIGAGGGWWLQESNDPNKNGSAWDRSHFNFNLPIEISVEKQLFKKVRGGVFGFYSAVKDNQIVRSTDQFIYGERIPIAKEWFTMLGGGLQGKYDILGANRFKLSLAGQLGFFHLNTIHPDEQGFKNKFVFVLGPNFTIKKGKMEYVFMPSYSEFRFNNTYQVNNKNRMYFLNFMFGVNRRISK